MPQHKKHIVKNEPLPASQDMARLKSEGIALAKQLSGDIWTDYNDHDPGVTILEQLCYALMEMSYKVHFDFEQLFFASLNPGEDIDLNNYFLLPPKDVFFTNPVTTEDYRKLFLDKWGHIKLKNIWVKADSDSATYTFFFQKPPDCNDNNSDIKQEILRTYHAYRNFGENCAEVVHLEPEQIEPHFSINEEQRKTLTNEQFIEGVAQFLYDVKTFLGPTIRYAHSIAELDLSEEEKSRIMRGPKPENKFIHPADLSATSLDKMEKDISITKFIERNSKRWSELICGPENETSLYKRVNTSENTIATFDVDTFLSEHCPDVKESIKKNFYNRFSGRLPDETIKWNTYQPHSSLTVAELKNYLSVQSTFPPYYNLGINDLTVFDQNRQDQIQELQSYLAISDALFVDFLVKMISFPQLLQVRSNGETSMEPGDSFTDIMDTIPGLDKLLVLDGQKKLKDIYKDYSFDTEQQIKLREYALRRYGEQFDTELINEAWGHPNNFEDRWLESLEELIRVYPEYSQARFNSYNLTDPESNFSLAKKLNTLLHTAQSKPNIFLVEGQLISDDASFFGSVSVILDFGQNKGNKLTERHKEAIKTIVLKELPGHLEAEIFFLSDDGHELNTLDDLFAEELSGNSLNRTPFKDAYKKWRKNKADQISPSDNEG